MNPLYPALAAGLIGHILCGMTDCMLGYSKKGRIDLRCIKDPERMREEFAEMPLSYPLWSMLLGTLAITMFGFGYIWLARDMEQYSKTAAAIMHVSAMVFIVPIVTHHVFCGAVEWLYIRLGRTDEAREAVLEMQKKTIATMFAGYAGLLVFLVTLFVMTVSGKTGLPQWACVFNTLTFMLLMLPTKIPAKGNVAGTLMYAGLIAMYCI